MSRVFECCSHSLDYVFVYLVNRTRNRRVCVILQGHISRSHLSTKNAHAGRTCDTLYEKMALFSFFFGEQGGESIHREFVQLASTFSHVKSATSRLKKMLDMHYLAVHPKNREMIPEKKKRNLKRNQQEQ